jgi:hypothetical protein
LNIIWGGNRNECGVLVENEGGGGMGDENEKA